MMLQKFDNLLKKWVLPLGIYEFARRLFSDIYGETLLLDRDKRITLAKNKKFKNINKGKRCFIVANGPSTKKQNLSLLKNEFVFFLNYGYLHKCFNETKHRYYCVPRIEEPFNPASTEWLRELDRVIPKDVNIFLSYYDKKTCNKNGLFKNNSNFVIHHNRQDMYLHKNIDLARTVPTISSSPMMCIQVALYMGFTKIYLLGTDYDYLVNWGKYSHFYSEKKEIWKPVASPYEKEVKIFLLIMNNFKSIKKYAEKRGVGIFNATPGGFLEVFGRTDLLSIFPKRGARADKID